MTRTHRLQHILTSGLLAALAGCGGPAERSAGEMDTAPGPGAPAGAGSSTAAVGRPWPADPCAWIPAAEAEAILGPLAGPPRPHEGGCLYPVPPDAQAARRQEAARRLEALAEQARRQGGSNEQPFPEDRRSTEPAVIVQVSVDASTAGEWALGKSAEIAARWLGRAPGSPQEATPPAPDGWDFAKSPIAPGLPGFLGRVGQLNVSVMPQAVRVPPEQVASLAARVRDAVPDGPFTPPGGAPPAAAPASAPDPCSLLTGGEAAAVLGDLTVAPYRVREVSPFPDPSGNSCAYRTRGHHVLTVTPWWIDGAAELQATGAIGGLIGAVAPGDAPEAADTLEGPWDEALADVASGGLLFRTGDRALRVSFVTSSTDAAGAVRLARIALGRLAGAAAAPR